MAEAEKCSQCIYYTLSQDRQDWGRCHARAPVPVGYGTDESIHEIIVPRPLVYGEDRGCSDSKAT